MRTFMEEFEEYKAPIKYRGKSLNDGRWVYGHYSITIEPIITHSDNEGGYIDEPVDCYTVSPYSGLEILGEDTEVYLGDVLSARGYVSFVVGFVDGCFVGLPTNRVQRINWTPISLKRLVSDPIARYAVVGNVYDTPDLIEV